MIDCYVDPDLLVLMFGCTQVLIYSGQNWSTFDDLLALTWNLETRG